MFALAASLGSTGALAATAGTAISNTASLRFDVDGADRTVSSNTVSTIVAEILDVSVVGEAAGMPARGARFARFRVTDIGNGNEAYILSATADDGATVEAVYVDTNGDGVFDPDVDQPIPATGVPLGAGQSAVVFVVFAGGSDQSGIALTAVAATGSGAPGTVFEGKGDGGGDAVIGQSGARVTTRIARTGGVVSQPTLVKSQSVLAPDGSAHAVKGAVITYRLDANFPSATSEVEITDQIPAGTGYVAGSLMLDGAPLSDGGDADVGRFDGSAVAVTLGTVSAGTRSISFQVKVQ